MASLAQQFSTFQLHSPLRNHEPMNVDGEGGDGDSRGPSPTPPPRLSSEGEDTKMDESEMDPTYLSPAIQMSTPPPPSHQLPGELISFVLSYLTPYQARHVSRVCKAWYPFGQALLWEQLVLSLGSPEIRAMEEAFFSESGRPFRGLIKRVRIDWANTADEGHYSERENESAKTLRRAVALLETMPEEVQVNCYRDLQSVELIFGIVLNPESYRTEIPIRTLPLKRLYLALLPASKHSQGGERRTNTTSQAELNPRLLAFFTEVVCIHLTHLYLDLPIGALDFFPRHNLVSFSYFDCKTTTFDTLKYILRATSHTLRYLRLAGDDVFHIDALTELQAPKEEGSDEPRYSLLGLQVVSNQRISSLYAKGTLVEEGAPVDVNALSIFKLLIPVINVQKGLASLSIGTYGTKPPREEEMETKMSALGIPFYPFRSLPLDEPGFWRALPMGLKELAIESVLEPKARGVVDWLQGGGGGHLVKMKVEGSEGRVVRKMLEDRGVLFVTAHKYRQERPYEVE